MFGRPLTQAVSNFSYWALEAGCHGIILPGTQLHQVKDLKTIKVATGIRPTWYHDDRHQQEVTPTEAAQAGANFEVCGSPILKQPTIEGKIIALSRVLAEMQTSA